MESFEQPREIGTRPFRILAASIGGLILAIAVAGIVAIFENEQVKDVTERSLLYDLEVEDEGDDLRVAVLDVRHHHRNIVFNGPTTSAVIDFEVAYLDLLEEVGELELLTITDPSVPQPSGIREQVERYYADFRPAIDQYESDPETFRRASDEGLRRIEELDNSADEIDELGEELTETALVRVDDAVATERFYLIALEIGVAIMSVILVFTALRVLAQLRSSYEHNRAISSELYRALRTKTDFIADASHELRTPLTVIRGNAEIGLSTQDENIRQDVLSEIDAESIRMSALVDDLLFLARSDAGHTPIDVELAPVHWLLSRVKSPAEVLAQQRQSCLKTDLVGEGYITVDPARIEQAVLILVDNAAKHASPDTCVTLTTRIQGEKLAIEVADQGPGIPPEEMAFIFDRFYQVGNRRFRKQDGSGLGLAIAKTIVEAHKGTIEANSGLAGGTRMTIRLPLNTVTEPAAL